MKGAWNKSDSDANTNIINLLISLEKEKSKGVVGILGMYCPFHQHALFSLSLYLSKQLGIQLYAPRALLSLRFIKRPCHVFESTPCEHTV